MGVFKVWQFLDSWGIINYQAGAGGDEDADGVPIKVQPAGDAHFYCLSATLSQQTRATTSSSLCSWFSQYSCYSWLHDTRTNK